MFFTLRFAIPATVVNGQFACSTIFKFVNFRKSLETHDEIS